MENKVRKIKDVLSDTNVDMGLLESSAVTAEMKRQWDAKGEPDDRLSRIGEKAGGSVMKQISGGFSYRALRRWKRYGIAASLLLLATLGIGIAMNRDALAQFGTEYYVYHSGNQDRVSITLDDNTVVTLGARSKLVYPKEFKGGKRTVEMEGQAYFKVAPDPAHPFVVETRSLDVTALGTAFEIFEDENQSFTEVILAEGRVRVDYPEAQSTGSRTLNPDEKLVHLTADNSVRVFYENAANYTAWKDRHGLTFVRERLSNVLPRLEKWYGCTIVCSSPEILDETFTFRVRTESPELIFDNMDLTLDIEYRFDSDNNTYFISKPRL